MPIPGTPLAYPLRNPPRGHPVGLLRPGTPFGKPHNVFRCGRPTNAARPVQSPTVTRRHGSQQRQLANHKPQVPGAHVPQNKTGHRPPGPSCPSGIALRHLPTAHDPTLDLRHSGLTTESGTIVARTSSTIGTSNSSFGASAWQSCRSRQNPESGESDECLATPQARAANSGGIAGPRSRTAHSACGLTSSPWRCAGPPPCPPSRPCRPAAAAPALCPPPGSPRRSP